MNHYFIWCMRMEIVEINLLDKASTQHTCGREGSTLILLEVSMVPYVQNAFWVFLLVSTIKSSWFFSVWKCLEKEVLYLIFTGLTMGVRLDVLLH